jgi:hypothetical protein
MEIAKRYHATTADKSTQIVFLDVGVPDKKEMPPLPASVRGGAAQAIEAPVVARVRRRIRT